MATTLRVAAIVIVVFERCALLASIGMPIVNGGDASFDVIEDFRNYELRDA